MKRLLPFILGLAFTVSWQNGWNAPTQIQYAITPTSTWKTLGIAPAGDNTFDAPAAGNTMTRGRYYYFRMRHLNPDNTALTPWSKTIGAVWLTGNQPTDNATYLVGKTDNVIVKFP